jgi:hypothetical protein
MNVAGNFIATGGTFNANGGTLVLDGVNQSVSGSSVFFNFTKTVSAAATLTFTAGSTQTIIGLLTLEGAAGSLLRLRSSVTGTQWLINPEGTRAVSYVDVEDSDNINATPINPPFSKDSGDNTNWFLMDDRPTPAEAVAFWLVHQSKEHDVWQL